MQEYYIDFNSAETLVWSESCKYVDEATNSELSSCYEAPVLSTSKYDTDRFNKNTELISKHNAFNMSGFKTEASLYRSDVCLNNGNCKTVDLYAATKVY